MKLLMIFRRSKPTATTAGNRAAERQSVSPPICPAQLLVDYKSTLTSIAAYQIDRAVRSAVDPNILRTIDSAVGEVFYDVVFDEMYPKIRNAIVVTWRKV
jgi:hypothetical protein